MALPSRRTVFAPGCIAVCSWWRLLPWREWHMMPTPPPPPPSPPHQVSRKMRHKKLLRQVAMSTEYPKCKRWKMAVVQLMAQRRDADAQLLRKIQSVLVKHRAKQHEGVGAGWVGGVDRQEGVSGRGDLRGDAQACTEKVGIGAEHVAEQRGQRRWQLPVMRLDHRRTASLKCVVPPLFVRSHCCEHH